METDGDSGRGAQRITFVVTLASRSARYGGPTMSARDQADAAERAGFPSHLIAGFLKGDEPEIEPTMRLAPVRRWVPSPGFVGYFSLAIAKLLWREVGASEIVHVAYAREAIPLYATLVAVLRRRRVVIQPHGMLTSRTSVAHRVVDVIARPLARRADVSLCLTASERSELVQWFGTRRRAPMLEVIGNLPETAGQEHATPTEWDGRRVALFAARLHARKRVVDFVAAARLAHEAGSLTSFVVAGADQGELQTVTSALSELPNLQYLGALEPDAVHRELSRAGCFVLPSRDEAWGQLLVAAMLGGIPVVACESAALSGEIVRLGAGAVVPDSNPGELRKAIERLLDQREEGSFSPDEVGVATRFAAGSATAALHRVYRSLPT